MRENSISMASPEREDQRLQVFLDEKWVEFTPELQAEVVVGLVGFLRYRI
jgi:hypothetical protein